MKTIERVAEEALKVQLPLPVRAQDSRGIKAWSHGTEACRLFECTTFRLFFESQKIQLSCLTFSGFCQE